MECCDLFGNAGGDWVGCIASQDGLNGNISVDPGFCDAASGSFGLWSDSPCGGLWYPDCGQIGAFGTACSSPPSDDIIGLYVDTENFDYNCYLPQGSVLTLYLVLQEASDQSGIMAWECAVSVPDNVYFLNAIINNESMNMLEPPSFSVFPSPPLPGVGSVVLAELMYFANTAQQSDFFINPVNSSSVVPAAPCYIPTGNQTNILPLTPLLGSTQPAFILNPADGGAILTINALGSGDYSSLQAAIDNADDGSTIVLEPGTYTGAGNYDIDFGGRILTVRAASSKESSGKVGECIIDCGGSSGNNRRAFHFCSGEGSLVVLDGLTITGGYESVGGAIYCENGSSPTIRNCTFIGNHAMAGGAFGCTGGSLPKLEHCVFVNNDSDIWGGGMVIEAFDEYTLSDCTFAGNTSDNGGAVYVSGGILLVRNTIMWGNTASTSGNQMELRGAEQLVFINCSDIQDGVTGISIEGELDYGSDNIDQDPMFCDQANGNVSLSVHSPCLAANNNCGQDIGVVGVSCDPVSAVDKEVPQVFFLMQNYPNPFNPLTTIKFGLAEDRVVCLSIYDLAGRRVSTLLKDESMTAGNHSITWDGRDGGGRKLASSVYFYRISMEGFTVTKKLTLLK